MTYTPPFTITTQIIDLISQISEQVGRIDAQSIINSPQLRRQNRIRTIQSTLAIEGNTLDIEQVTAILEGKRILGNQREIAEVHGAIKAYEILPDLKPFENLDLLKAHGLMMADIMEGAGKYRKKSVGIHKQGKVVHVAPQAERVPGLMADLLSWVKASKDHALIKSSVFHYELEFIHPFMDGNGRMGRLWQTLILGQWKDVFYHLPLESVIKDRQMQYYTALEQADQAADSTVFVNFALTAISEAMIEKIEAQKAGVIDSSDQVADHVSDQVKQLLIVIGSEYVSANQLMEQLKLSHKPTFRKNYLNPALAMGLIEMRDPKSPRSPRQKYKKI